MTSEVATQLSRRQKGHGLRAGGGEQPISGPVLTQARRLPASCGPRQEHEKSGKGPSVPCHAAGVSYLEWDRSTVASAHTNAPGTNPQRPEGTMGGGVFIVVKKIHTA